uniref:Uncharacterized protein n=1 Tax=Limosilactobacillus reuteri subsp. suis (strain ATCC 53608 / LMG 31752 / 1063) TaxID=927703 RepID=F8KDW6_LIMR5|nr:hypothetical protein LRATCC53608_1039 [Limosilactobacillus reuteri subsp. suis]
MLKLQFDDILPSNLSIVNSFTRLCTHCVQVIPRIHFVLTRVLFYYIFTNRLY